ncbi:unnamed protein product [Cyclocybe aegerita]|uniref:BTB domain-containing protein n=1 Tax=Cyclocybe aegerita TaxID=1973307 RepID=A0A8S0W4B2_CYCAE|nr:unnamed protein product [Cyclocybe aegerita]
MSATEQPPLKRPRTSEESSTRGEQSGPQLVQSEDLWFEDGSVIIQAESTQFRVHKTVLARSSSMFCDVFQLGEKSASEAAVDGCPVVHVSDSAVEMHQFLRLLYDLKYGPDELPTFSQISAMLRLGRNPDGPPYKHFAMQPGVLFDIVTLAQEMCILSILPVALFYCTRLPLVEDREGRKTAAFPPRVRFCFWRDINLKHLEIKSDPNHDQIPDDEWHILYSLFQAIGDSCRTCFDPHARPEAAASYNGQENVHIQTLARGCLRLRLVLRQNFGKKVTIIIQDVDYAGAGVVHRG